MFRASPLSFGRAIFAIALAASAWGTGGAVAAMLYSAGGLDPLTVSFWRFLGGALALAAAWPLLRGEGTFSLVGRFRREKARFLATGVGMAVYQTAYFAAVDHAGVAVATVVTLGSGPILVAVGARLWMGERLGGRGALIIGSALAGLILLVSGGDPAVDSTAPVSGGDPAIVSTSARSAATGLVSSGDQVVGATVPILGIGLALLSAVGYAGTILLGRAIGTGDSAGSALIGFAVGSLCLFPFALGSGLGPEGGFTVTVVMLLAYLGVVPSALAYGLFFAGLRVVPSTTASVVALVEPLVATAIAVAFLGERLTVAAVLGGLVLLAAVVFSGPLPRSRPSGPAAPG
ncbi:EamA family transporter [Acrocarpospora macrocephala]|uniref:Membrane protein n=2 Tax=Acrocarpospora macrocephala TaxID=150177 RepID=A0A5M3WV62_9ACTN|nr:DMT family transporter [Acrocarpospora macrocephala]GES10453.1 membrane protein [Acrocarpospora macrocephala]